MNDLYMTHGFWVLYTASSALLASIPFGFLFVRIFHNVDIRKEGSGNIGATNVVRNHGFWPTGFLTFLADFLKGFIPVFLISVALSTEIWPSLSEWIRTSLASAPFDPTFFPWILGLIAVIGHCYSPFLRFNGGKGIATGFGVFLALSPISALISLLTFAIVFFETRIVAIASLTSAFSFLIMQLLFFSDKTYVEVLCIILFIIVVRHSENLERLISDKEQALTTQG